MTNKTVTLLPDGIHQMAFEEGQPAENGDGYLFTAEEFDLFVERLLTAALADPVPPAGGEVEVLAQFNGLTFNSRRPYDDDKLDDVILEGDGDFCDNNLQAAVWFLENGTELRALVTGLQAEVGALRYDCKVANSVVNSLQSEVGRLSQIGSAYDEAISASNELGYAAMCAADVIRHQANELADLQAELTKALELIGSLDEAWNSHDGKVRFGDLMKKVELLAHQSAPAEEEHEHPY